MMIKIVIDRIYLSFALQALEINFYLETVLKKNNASCHLQYTGVFDQFNTAHATYTLSDRSMSS